MSSFEDSYKSQLQGVSQQTPRERIDGQMSAQENMLSDVVTNLRRRPGAAAIYNLSVPDATDSSILCWDTDLAGQKIIIMLNIVDGSIRVLSSTTYDVLATLTNAYLAASKISSIQVATVGDEFFLCNTEKAPALGANFGYVDPTNRGFLYIKSGAFSKTYDCKVQTSAGSFTASFSTPNGTGAGDAAAAAPENIAEQLRVQINNNSTAAQVWCERDGSYLTLYSINGSSALTVNTSSGTNYAVGSGQSYVRQSQDLPGRLHSVADGYIVGTGEMKNRQYYRFDYAQLAWLECGNWASPSGLTNMPVRLTYGVSTGWTLTATAYEGRLAGDDDTNPHPEFIARGISGMSAYQGRLVLLSGGMVSMSAAGKPLRFYRSTVTSILDSDCIGVGAQAASSASYRHAVPFQKDLLLFSEKYQAVIPGNNTAITPRTASVVVTSSYETDTGCRPLPLGRTMMYSAPRSADFFGVLEMYPSTQTDSTYTSVDSTGHLPKYMAGRSRFSVASSVANLVLFAPSGDRNSLICHEYVWDAETKVQSAWHKWTFKYPVANAYFSGSVVHVVFVKNGIVVGCVVDPRQGVVTANAERRPFLDMSSYATVTDNLVAYPAWMQTFDPAGLADARLAVATGPMAGEPVGFTLEGQSMRTVRSFPSGQVAIGFPFRSTFSPTPPMVKDSNGVKISSNKLTILRFSIGTLNSAQYMVAVRDGNSGDADTALAQGTLYFSSAELGLGKARNGADSMAVVPCRTDANSTSLVVYTEGTGDLNLVSLEYVGKYHEKIARWNAKVRG